MVYIGEKRANFQTLSYRHEKMEGQIAKKGLCSALKYGYQKKMFKLQPPTTYRYREKPWDLS